MIKNVLQNLISPPATRAFPKERRATPADVRGMIEFNGENCTYCSACSLKCPTDAIVVDRKAQTLDFDVFRCILCNCCVEACKKDCVEMATSYRGPQQERLMVHFETPITEKAEADGEEATPKPRPARVPRRAVATTENQTSESEAATPAASVEQSADSPMAGALVTAQNEG